MDVCNRPWRGLCVALLVLAVMCLWGRVLMAQAPGNAPAPLGTYSGGTATGPTGASGGVLYYAPNNAPTAVIGNATEATVQTLTANQPCYAQNLAVSLSPGSTSGVNYLVQVRVAGSGVIGCTVSGPSGTKCTSGSTGATIAAGSAIAMGVTCPNLACPGSNIKWGWECR